MKVAIIKSRYTPYGGAEKYAAIMVRAFAERGHEVHVLTSGHTEWPEEEFVKYIRLPQIGFNNLLRLLTFNESVKKYLERVRYDCILGMDNTEIQTHIRLGGGLHRAWLDRRSEESSFLKRLSFSLNPFHRTMVAVQEKALHYHGLKRIICNSRLVMNEIAYYYPEAVDKAVVIHNGVEWNELAHVFEVGLTEREQILKRLNLQPDRFYYLFVGSGYERKGLEKAIKALKGMPDYTSLIVVGRDKNEKRFHELAEKLGLKERVYFFGPRKDVVNFYQVSDAFVLPTLYDPFSNATLEALAMGLFTITSDANGAAEIIWPGAGVIIKDLKDTEAVKEALSEALKPHLSKTEIRDSVRSLELENQVKKIIDICVER
ncbi:MAG: glycosyltransferase family 4 protein [Thermodesulfovibrionales bacterium]|nr:glycosyltransferase family 4 protein [Thermodesulfovibrionales bacterium]